MVNLTSIGPQPIKPSTNNVSVMSNMVSKRSAVDLLPGVNQTETMVKFFNATIDHMFQPEDVEFISGYIGSKPAYYNKSKDYYISEADKVRANYQLPVTAVSLDKASGTINNVLFYDDLLNQLSLQGANIKDPSRLLEGDYYSWSPPIDMDKFINFSEYYWLPDGPSILVLMDPTDILNDALDHDSYTYTGRYLRLLDNVVVDGPLVFSSGMRIQVADDQNLTLAGRTLVIERVGRGIQIEDDTIFQNPSWDTTGWDTRSWDGGDSAVVPDYMTIGRMSKDLNRWSVNNRWFHRDIVVASGLSILDQQSSKALRPIIEFEPNIHLYNFGSRGRPDVDLIDTTRSDFFNSIAGQPSAVIDGTNLIDGMRILVTADVDTNINNRIYQVSGLFDYGLITLTLVSDGINADGSSAVEEVTYVNFGVENGRKSFWYNGTKWVKGQDAVKTVPPQFAGYDRDGINLIDPAVYPGSNFAGNTIFTYAIDTTASVDPILGIQVKRDQFGDFIFENTLVTKTYTYLSNNQQTAINGYTWYLSDNLANGWYKSRNPSRQYIVNSFDIVSPTTTFLVDQWTVPVVKGQLPTLKVYKITGGASNLLVDGVDYLLEGRIVTLTTPAAPDDRIDILSWSPNLASSNNGYYRLPLNLVANPNNDQPTVFGFNQVVQHFTDIISNQAGEKSAGLGATTWRDSQQVRGLGTSILQHRSPLLKLMMLNSSDINLGMLGNNSPTDPSLAIQFAQREYVRFYNRFIRSLFKLYSGMGYSKGVPAAQWITAALEQVNLGKTKASTWAYSGYEMSEDFTTSANKPTFIPPTASKLGAAPVYRPEAYLDDDYYPAKLTLQTHDGARIVMEDLEGLMLGTIDQGATKTSNPVLLTHPVAAAWLQFELNLYNGVPAEYRSVDAVPAFDRRIYAPGKWRSSDYSRSEYTEILLPSFDKWVITNQVDYRANTGFSMNNQFSFNYRTCFDRDGQAVPGHWRGIFRWFYDTDRPHTHPWEMLGFSQRPTWWANEYGPAPYTKGNILMWQDLASGIIKQGSRAGVYQEWARPGLLGCIPVDEQGDLLSPLAAGTVVSLPSFSDGQAEWIFGDGSPIESVWINSLDHGFAIAITGYLMKPARFIEQAWDPLRIVRSGTGNSQQYLYIDTNKRRSSSEFYVHRENPASISNTAYIPNESSLSFFGSWGIQHWISEFLINQNISVTKYMGNIIRGTNSQLAHKFGGFVGTDNSLRVMADSFGQIGYTSQMIPSENVQTYLYRSTSIGVHFYSGVIVVKQRNGWKVYGYDGINPVFNIIPSVTTGPKSSMMIGNQSINDYQMGQGVAQVKYGTVFSSTQEVYDFLISYGRWLESDGWKFDLLNRDTNKVLDWRQSGRDFVYWSQGNWADGNFVALSPLAGGAKFKQDFGTIQYVNGTIGGTYPVLDKSGQPIEKQNLEILREDGEIVVSTLNPQTIYGLRLFATTVEHIMLLDNVTQFNDLIYDPLFNLSQPRLKIYGYRTNNWNGRLDAPGYFLYQDPTTSQWKMISNFEKTAEDFRNIYNIDQPKNTISIDPGTGQQVNVSNKNHAVTRTDLGDLAKHLIGYQKRDYLQNLLLDETTEFQFYQGFIRQKGSKRALDSMLRNTNIIGSGEQINYYEEFALRRARYGAVSLNTNIDFILSQKDFGNSPQRIDVFSRYDSDQSRYGAIEIVPRDPRIVVPPDNYEGNMFPLRKNTGNDFYDDFPTAGYVQLGEATWTVLDSAALLTLSTDLKTQGKSLSRGDTVWQLITDNQSWNIWRVVLPPSNVVGTNNSQQTGVPTTINFDGPHGVVNGDIIVCSDFANNESLSGTFVAQNVTVTTVTIPVSTFIDETAGNVKVYRSIRFYDKCSLDDSVMLGGWEDGNRAYVDNGVELGQWTVYLNVLGGWEVDRRAQKKVEANLMLESKLYNKKSLSVVKYMEYYDPAKGIIPGPADREISFKDVFDPARYNNGDSTLYSLHPDQAWAASHVGEVWWDLSTTRFVDYEQGTIDYRIKNWGKIVPGTAIDIYEWVRSPIAPSEWSVYAAGNVPLTQFGLSYTPSGTVRNPSSPAWTQTTEYDANGNYKTWYYFWVTQSSLKPMVPGRTLTTREISTGIMNPDSNDISWYAAVSDRTLIVANVYRHLDSENTVMHILYTDKPNDANDHKEWALVRAGDQYCQIDEQYWSKMRDSLTGFDMMGNQVPDPHLNELQRYGNQIRPRQSWFRDRLKALGIWTKTVNSHLANAKTPLVLDPDKFRWYEYFKANEPTPPATDRHFGWDYSAADMSEMKQLSPMLRNGQRVLVSPVAANNNLWTIWSWDAYANDFLLMRVQSYRVQSYWTYQDWYYTGYSSTTIPTYTVSTVNDISDIVLTGSQTAKVLDYGSYGWALFAMVNGIQTVVGLQDGTIQITDNLWNSDVNLDGWDRISYDTSPFDYNPTIEIGLIFDGVKEGIYGSGSSIELNKMFFSMINYVLSEQKYVDWVFKTSYMLISGSNEPLSGSQLYQPSTVDSLLDYINEAKPYRSKIRDFISGRSISDTARMGMYDFDKPPYEGSILDPNNLNDANILASDSTYSPWYDHYKTDPNLIRMLKTQLVFDRVASMPARVHIQNARSTGTTVSFTVSPDMAAASFVVGEMISVANVVSTGNTLVSFNSANVVVTTTAGNLVICEYYDNIGTGAGAGGIMTHQSFGAAARIMSHYRPTAYMPQLNDPTLISGTDYKGHVYDGTSFGAEPGWGMSPWDFPIGWDPDAASFDQYLDTVLEGGMPPVYDQFYGDGNRVQFRLTKIPQDLLHTKVWRDRVLAEYGVDYIVPNWADRVEIADPGQGYKINELVRLVPDKLTPNSKSIEAKITAVKNDGMIVSAVVTNRGYYEMIQHHSFNVEYAPYQEGEGRGAAMQPVWGGDTLVFASPPLQSDRPNIWVLYAGTTFESAPDGETDLIIDGNEFVQPNVEADRAEELYTTKLRDAVRLDTYSQAVGGRPIVVNRNYFTDGVSDHYDIGIRPQDSSAVLAFLDGVQLDYGPTGDYVINFETGNIVFVRTPAAGRYLTMTSIGEGGSGNNIASAYVVSGGDGYSIGDIITLDGGVPVDNSINNRATVTVTAVAAGTISVVNGGTNYKVGDVLILEGGQNTSRLIIKIKSASKTGAVTSVTIVSNGNYQTIPSGYQELPSSIQWLTNSKGTGAVLSISWSVSAVAVSNSGLYITKPKQAFGQWYIVPAKPGFIGAGATFNAMYTSILSQEHFLADGFTDTFNLRVAPTDSQSVMVTVNGSVIPFFSIVLFENTITIPTPKYGSYVVITVFNTSQYSVSYETEVIATFNNSTQRTNMSYILDRPANDTNPDYLSTVVTVNGVLLSPPATNTYMGNGGSTRFALNYQPTDLNLLQVYIDGILKISGTDYTVNNQMVTMASAPVNGAIVVMVIVDPDYGFYYRLDGDVITFEDTDNVGFDDLGFDNIFGFDFDTAIIKPLDRISVTTFTQDLSYRFETEQFLGNEAAIYALSGTPSSESTLIVSVNNVVQRMLWNYALITEKVGNDTVYYVRFDSSTYHSDQDSIVVRYMIGKSEKPATAFRQFVTPAFSNISQVISPKHETVLLSDVYVYTSEIEVADYTALSPPTAVKPGAIWIGNERISFTKMTPSATSEHPHRAFISDLIRSSNGTSSSPSYVYDVIFHDGNGNITVFSSNATAGQSETVCVDNRFQAGGNAEWHTMPGNTYRLTTTAKIVSAESIRIYVGAVKLALDVDYVVELGNNTVVFASVYPNGTVVMCKIDQAIGVASNYYTAINPPGRTSGRYVMFEPNSIPAIGNRNIRLTTLVTDAASYSLSHAAGSKVQDSGSLVNIPGGYKWEAAPDGLQYSNSGAARFILEQ